MEKSRSSVKTYPDLVARGALLGLLFLTPLFFIPSPYIILDSAKVILLAILVLVAFCGWVIGRLQEGKLALPKDYFFFALIAVPLAFLVSAIFSPAKSMSFFGQGFESQTFWFIATACLLTFLVSVIFDSKKFIAYSYLALIATFPLVFLFQILRIVFGPGFMAFGIFTSTTASLLGGWNDLGIYLGLIALLSFLTIELLAALDRRVKISLIIVLIVALFMLSVVDFLMVWYVLGSVALIFFVYNFSFSRGTSSEGSRPRRNIPLTSLLIVVISFVFIILQTNVYGLFSAEPFDIHVLSHLDVNDIEVRPAWYSTFEVAEHAFAKSPIIGAGPNRFVNDWVLWKPSAVNQTIFWSTDFPTATSFIATSIATTGIIGVLAWLAFLGLFLYAGIRTLFKKTDPFQNYLSVSAFLIALYFWIFALLYTPSISTIILSFFFTGLFFASLAVGGLAETFTFDFIQNPRASFFSVLAFLVLIFGSLLYGYETIRVFAAARYFNEATTAAAKGASMDDIQSLLDKAESLHSIDQYYQASANVNLARLNTLISSSGVSAVTAQAEAKGFVTNAFSAAENAVAVDPTNYQNWLTLGQVYDVLSQLGTTGAYAKAQSTYAEAQALDPTNPEIPLVLSRLAAENSDYASANKYASEALSLKSNYVDALFFAAQLQASEGDLKSAIASAESAAATSPTDPDVYYELGLLEYENKDYSDAAAAFQQAIVLASGYANAQYFLGLSDYYLGDISDAIAQFKALEASNPNDQELATIVSNLEAGHSPLSTVPPPDNNPTKRPTAPLNDSSATSTKTKNSGVTEGN